MNQKFAETVKRMIDDEFEELTDLFISDAEELGETLPKYFEIATMIYKNDYVYKNLKDKFFPELSDEEYWEKFKEVLNDMDLTFDEDDDGFELRRTIRLEK